MSELYGAIGFGILSAVLLYLAWRANYFAFPKEWDVSIRWYHTAAVFAIYFAGVSLIVPLISWLFRPILSASPLIAATVWLNFLTSFIILAAIAFYSATLPRAVAWGIWRRDPASSFIQDLKFALLTFVIAFPLVIFLDEAFDLILFYFFQVTELPEQLAVRFLKMTFDYPRYLFLSVATIVVFAPMLEEVLFRGFLQSFLRQRLGSKSAILLTSLCFAFFHYSPEQGLSNISIIASLFALALFLGFTYEKQGSLAAPMLLHASFNAISVLNLYFLGSWL